MAKISDYGKDLRLWQRSQIMAKISDYGKNLRLWQSFPYTRFEHTEGKERYGCPHF
jgi:hypothetical protein